MSLDALHRRAQKALAAGRLDEVAQCCSALLEADPSHADAWFLSGLAAAGRRQASEALGRLERAARLKPDRAEYQAQLAKMLVSVHRWPAARDAAARVLALPNGDALALDTAGVVLARTGDQLQASLAFSRAVGLRPERADFRFNLGAACRFIGRPEAALEHFRAGIAADRRFWRAWPPLAELAAPAELPSMQLDLEGLLQEAGTEIEAALYLNVALSRIAERVGDMDAAFDRLRMGKAAWRARSRYSHEHDAACFAAAARTAPGPLPSPTRHGRALFIVGMPRSGTTLLERMLAQHPEVAPGGELPHLPLLIKRAAATPGGRVLDPATLQAATAADCAAIGQRYLDETVGLAAGHARLTDKLPLNIFNCGIIARALPDARMLCLRRDPLDTCLGNFRQLFARDFHYYDYSWDLLDIGRWWQSFDRLAAHWRRTLPGRFLEVQYESLVADPECELRRVLAFSGLEWSAACLDFAADARAVATASALQVREHLHSRSIGRWRQWAPRLGELRCLLEEGGRD
ncbi:MAG: sulfotransferase [Chromatiales bacterium]|nr:sulfotransferase [Chromatiales bacterium]